MLRVQPALAGVATILTIIAAVSASDICQLCACLGDVVNCSGLRLDAVPAPLPSTVIALDLSNNRIASIQPSAFSEAVRLQRLDLSRNAIALLGNDSFDGLSELTYLNLNGNPLSYATGFSEGTFSRLAKLQALHLVTDGCPDVTVDGHLEALLSLNTLAIAIGKDGGLGDKLGSLRKLDTLFLTSPTCSVARISFDTMRSLSSLPIRRLSLRNVGLQVLEPAVLTMFNRTLEKIDVSCNRLRNLPAVIGALRNSRLETLLADAAVDSFVPVELSVDVLSALSTSRLRVLSLACNEFLEISMDASFIKYIMPSLHYLRIGYNQIILRTALTKDELIMAAVAVFYNVSVVDANGLFSIFTDNSRNHLPVDCTDLDPLFSDQTQPWEKDVIAYPPPTTFLKWLADVVLRFYKYNLITLPPVLTRLYAVEAAGAYTIACEKTKIYRKNNLQVVAIGGGLLKSIDCDDSGLSSVTNIELSRSRLRRFNPSFFSSGSMPFLSRLDLHGNELAAFIESNSSEGLFSGMPGIQYLDLSDNGIAIIPADVFLNVGNLTVLNLSHNVIRQWTASVASLVHLQTLDLSGNQIQEMPLRAMSEFDVLADQRPGLVVNLSSNPIKCSCDDMEFLHWLQETKVVHGVAHCADGSSARSLDLQLLRELTWRCRSMTAVIVGLSTLSACLLVVALCYACKWRLRYTYYKCKRLLHPVDRSWRAGELGIYISYHDDDCNRAAKLQRYLESSMGVARVVSRRNLVLGYYELEQIATNIDSSNISVVLVSLESFRDAKAEFEFYMSLEKDIHCVLPIVMTECICVGKLPRSLRKLLLCSSYLKWPSSSEAAVSLHSECTESEWTRFTVVFEAHIRNLLERQALVRSHKAETSQGVASKRDADCDREEQALLRGPMQVYGTYDNQLS